MSYIVAVDGPAGSGKGTITKIIEKELGLMNLDTGATYRCVALRMLEENVDIKDEERILELAKAMDLDIVKENGKDKIILNGKDVSLKIREKEVTNVVSQVSSIISVREEMVNLQRKIAMGKDVIVEGRDIASVVFPHANVKIYLDASPEVRAIRRQRQNEAANIETSYEEVLENIKARDYNDMHKPVGALIRVPEAIYIDCSELEIEDVVLKTKEAILGSMDMSILPNYFAKEDGRFDLDEALNFSGRIAGVCYVKENFEQLMKEDISKTKKRIDMTLSNSHHSVYDHIFVNLNIKNVPKIVAMILNNEKQYTTSEKSARYTKVKQSVGSIITNEEQALYEKWYEILSKKIKEVYPDFTDIKIGKLAQENARYFVTVFMPTEMIYTASLRQINYIASFMGKYIEENEKSTDEFNLKLVKAFKEFVENLRRLNLIEERLLLNEKQRNISLFDDKIEEKEEIYSHIYSVTYKGTYAQLAQAQRHRTIGYTMKRLDKKEYFVPPIIEEDKDLVKMWNEDMQVVSKYFPQGEVVLIHETGTYDNFILKLKERLCTHAQLEINNTTKEVVERYAQKLKESNNPLYEDILGYTKGARCTFKTYTCNQDCKFAEGKLLTRKI